MIRALWTYRDFILSAVRRDFEVKYRNSLLGFSWAILSPLATILVYALVFSELMHARLEVLDSRFSYSIFLCAGILHWSLFSEVTTRSLNMFIENANLIKKINFPKICLPAIIVCTSMINFFIVCIIFTLFLIATGTFPGWSFLMFFIVGGLYILLAVGIGVWLGVLNVFLRDVGQVFAIVLQFWFWLTPFIYPIKIIPDWLAPVVSFNPLTPLAIASQQAILTKAWPDPIDLAYPVVFALIACFIAFSAFRRLSGEIVDQL